MEIKYININFKNGFADRVPTVTQYDYGQHLRITGLSLPEAVEFHFKNQKSETTLLVAGITSDGVTTVQIPNSMLKEPHNITAYIYLSDGESGKTVYRIDLNMRVRNAPEEVPTDPDDEHYVNGVSELITAAAEAANTAKNSAQSAENAKEICISAAAATQALCDTLQPADAHYNKDSWVAQSGVAVGEAVAESAKATKTEIMAWTKEYTEENKSPVLMGNKSGAVAALSDIASVPHTINVTVKSENILSLPYEFGNSATVKGVAVTVDENGTITLNGTCTEDYEMGDIALKIGIGVDHEATYECRVESTGDFGTLHFFCEHEDAFYGYSSYMLSSTKRSDSFTGIKTVQLYLYLTKGTVYNNVKFTPSLMLTGDVTPKIRKCGKNLFPFAESLTIKDSYVDSATDAFLPTQTNIHFLRGEKITFSAHFDLTGAQEETAKACVKIIYYNAYDMVIEEDFGNTLDKANGDTMGYSSLTAVVPENTEKITFCPCVFFNGIETPMEDSFITVSNCMVELGKTRTEYEAYTREILTVNDNSALSITYTSGNITLISESLGYTLFCEYNRDINKVISKIESVIAELGGEI